MKVTYEIECLEEDARVEGNALASGDETEDKIAEFQVLERLRRGDLWAWCTVRVVARVDGIDIIGENYLGCCSYADEADFKADIYEDMCAEALEDLREKCRERMYAGHEAEKVLEALALTED